jgi:hypothetical protein
MDIKKRATFLVLTIILVLLFSTLSTFSLAANCPPSPLVADAPCDCEFRDANGNLDSIICLKGQQCNPSSRSCLTVVPSTDEGAQIDLPDCPESPTATDKNCFCRVLMGGGVSGAGTTARESRGEICRAGQTCTDEGCTGSASEQNKQSKRAAPSLSMNIVGTQAEQLRRENACEMHLRFAYDLPDNGLELRLDDVVESGSNSVRAFVDLLGQDGGQYTIYVHGFSSWEGDRTYNTRLAGQRIDIIIRELENYISSKDLSSRITVSRGTIEGKSERFWTLSADEKNAITRFYRSRPTAEQKKAVFENIQALYENRRVVLSLRNDFSIVPNDVIIDEGCPEGETICPDNKVKIEDACVDVVCSPSECECSGDGEVCNEEECECIPDYCEWDSGVDDDTPIPMCDPCAIEQRSTEQSTGETGSTPTCDENQPDMILVCSGNECKLIPAEACTEGQTRDAETGECTGTVCSEGQEFNEEEDACTPVAGGFARVGEALGNYWPWLLALLALLAALFFLGPFSPYRIRRTKGVERIIKSVEAKTICELIGNLISAKENVIKQITAFEEKIIKIDNWKIRSQFEKYLREFRDIAYLRDPTSDESKNLSHVEKEVKDLLCDYLNLCTYLMYLEKIEYALFEDFIPNLQLGLLEAKSGKKPKRLNDMGIFLRDLDEIRAVEELLAVLRQESEIILSATKKIESTVEEHVWESHMLLNGLFASLRKHKRSEKLINKYGEETFKSLWESRRDLHTKEAGFHVPMYLRKDEARFSRPGFMCRARNAVFSGPMTWLMGKLHNNDGRWHPDEHVSINPVDAASEKERAELKRKLDDVKRRVHEIWGDDKRIQIQSAYIQKLGIEILDNIKKDGHLLSALFRIEATSNPTPLKAGLIKSLYKKISPGTMHNPENLPKGYVHGGSIPKELYALKNLREIICKGSIEPLRINIEGNKTLHIKEAELQNFIKDKAIHIEVTGGVKPYKCCISIGGKEQNE